MEVTKPFKGKAIYQPAGKAGEYAKYACNFYRGCSNGCTYCYLRKGVLAHSMGGNTPILLNRFKDEEHALEVFEKELKANLPELREHGLFMSFTTDPYLKETIELTYRSIYRCMMYKIHVKILTKRADFVNGLFYHISLSINFQSEYKRYVAFGFTLTGHDELEPNASTNAERIKAMRKLHEAGFKTWASIEPVIDFESSLEMIKSTMEFCGLYKIGLESGKKYDRHDINVFMQRCFKYAHLRSLKIYFKDGFLKRAGISRSELPDSCVNRDYNLFKDKQI
jgi:DNA repair photolyase